MSQNRSRADLLEFLDYLAEKGLMAKNTAAARKAAAGKVLGILSDDEASDVTALDLDAVIHRFQNLEGRSYTPGSLSTYFSRTRSAIDDFSAYLSNPLAYRPKVQKRESKHSDNKATSQKANREAAEVRHHTAYYTAHASTPAASSSILPIPIRQDVTVRIQGIPFDLTEQEAERIANVVKAMAIIS